MVPRVPRGERRPTDMIGAAVQVVQIVTGAEKETVEPASLAGAAAALGKLGGAARAKSLTAEQRQEIARKGAAKRWGDKGKAG